MCSAEDAFKEMIPNIVQYEHYIRQAASEQADIVLFPEDGLTGFEFTNSDFFRPFVQHIPDDYHHWSPCKDPSE